MPGLRNCSASAPLAVLEKLGLPARYEVVEDTARPWKRPFFDASNGRVEKDATLRESYVAMAVEAPSQHGAGVAG